MPDFKNMSYPLGSCGPGTAAFTLRDGALNKNDPNDQHQHITLDRVESGQLDSTGPLEVVVLLSCHYAMTDHFSIATLWAVRGGEYRPVTQAKPVDGRVADYGGFGFSSHPIRFVINQGRLEITDTVYEPFDANCCPSTLIRTTYHLDADTLVADGIPKVLAQRQPPPDSSYYPYVSLINGYVHGFDVSALANLFVLRTFASIDLSGMKFGDSPTCKSVEGGGRECKVPVVTKRGPRTITLTADNGEPGNDTVDDFGVPIPKAVPWVIDSMSIS